MEAFCRSRILNKIFLKINSFLVSTQRVTEQVKGAALIPKLAVDVMTCEVLRLMLLTKSSIMALSYHVPRKVNE